MTADKDRDGWHLDKKVPISIIVMIVMQGAAGLWVVADIKKDVEVLKAQGVQQQIQQRDRDERQDKQATDALGQVRAQLERVESKLDRLIERQKP